MEPLPKLTSAETAQINDFKGFFEFKTTWLYLKLINCPYKIKAFFTGNQYGKNDSIAMDYVLRVLGKHLVNWLNVLYFECEKRVLLAEDLISEEEFIKEHGAVNLIMAHFNSTWGPFNVAEKCTCGGKVVEHIRKTRIFRFASENMPGQTPTEKGESVNETRNSQYPAIMRRLPGYLVKKPITFRNPSLTLHDPFGRGDIIFEFVGYNQSTQSTAGVQRLSCWLDEQPNFDFYEEQLPRLLIENGDMLMSLTPSEHVSWTYDHILERARIYFRTETICKFLSTSDNEVKQIEHSKEGASIAVFQAATDDNPVMSRKAVEELMEELLGGDSNDPDMIAIRRYGIHKQVSGRIFKEFDWNVHFLNRDKYFPNGIPHDYVHARGIDYHPRTNWAIGMISISDKDEAFIWGEFNPSPEKMTTREIVYEMALLGKDYQFRLNKIDPESTTIKKDGITILDDINREIYELKRNGLGEGGCFRSWDTKGERGRDAIKQRLKNAKLVGKPFNNVVVQNGRKVILPTLWILDSCKETAKAMRQWRWEEYKNSRDSRSKEAKNTPEQKNSHFNMVFEAIFKDPAFKPNVSRDFSPREVHFFQGRA